MPPDRPLRILHLTAGSDAGGLSRYLLDLSTALRGLGHTVTVAGERGAWHGRFETAGLPWIDVPLKGGPLALWNAARALSRHSAGHPVDLIHTHYRRPTLVARRVQRSTGVPVLYTVHQPRIAVGGPWRWLTDFGDHTHVPSEDARRWLADDCGVAPGRISVIPHGIDAARFPRRDPAAKAAARAALGLPADARVAAFVGRLDVPKNAGWMLDVAAASRATLPDLKILLAGDGPEAPLLHRRVAQEGLADRVILLGDRDPLGVYQAADALLSPSQREGFLLVCGEAMSVGIPVLRTDTGGAREMIIEGVTGQTTPVDRGAFTRATIEFLTDVNRLERMGEAAAEHVRGHFPFNVQVERTVDLYRRLVAKK